MKKRYVVWAFLVVVSAGMSLHTSLLTRAEERKLENINHEIAAEKTRIKVLEAEWTVLTAPDRLETLSTRYLKEMVPSSGMKEVVQLASIPDRLEGASDEAAGSVALAQNNIDNKPSAATAPVQLAKAALPVRQAQAEPQVDENDEGDDPIRVLIEEQHMPQSGVLLARADRVGVGGTGGANR